MAATIKDIKELTGLSLATISKYLNGGNLRPENRAKIEKAISELHYEVNEMARGLVTSRSKVIGVVVFDIANVFTCTLLKYLGENFRRAGYAPMICDSQNDPELEAENIRFLLSKKVDGMIVIPAGQTAAFLQPARNAGIPLVLMDRSLKGSGIDCVKVNNTASSYQAVEKLYDYGHRRIAIIGSDLEITGKERLDGYLKLLEEKKISVPPQYIKLGPHSIEHGYKSMQELLKLEEPPTAVFMGNFEIILGAVMALNESPFECPSDVSLIGFDDLIISNLSNPRLTLVVQPLRELADSAAELLLKKLEKGERQDNGKNGFSGEEPPAELPEGERILPARIVEGESIARI